MLLIYILGQYYNIILKDDKGYDGDIISTVSITFHDESHRVSATDYWKFWLTQQKDSEEARAIELDLTRSSGAQAVEGRMFDRVSFKWNGRMGASVHVRFNCLSTDFSRIKGVKGIPLRLQIKSEQPPSDQDIRFSQFFVEKTYCRIKLFRDKGAERKNKDDAKHIERQLEKLRGKNGEPHPLWLAYSPTLPITLFKEIVPPEEDDIQPSYHSVLDNRSLLQQQQQQSHMVSPSSSALLLPPPPLPSIGAPNMKRSYSSFSASQAEYPNYQPSFSNLALDIDPSYVPQRRRRIAKLSLLVKFESSEVYRAVYLEHLTLKEFTDKIKQRMEIQKPISNVYRKTMAKDKKPIIVKVDDEVIQDLKEEQDIHIETEDNPEKEGTVNLILNF
ncbi:CP2 transcription factor-domain-containing protein [Gilbertella persicaria]|uniref:CP2 transcription factor-domain-containing protein n=1 Tax=Gilbertella persicaria TaxID=101096 RepID=UPI00221F423D|nr:CP2 transcription factor-domain-containing protein [Gilbertella persicaria]KAI8075369.1 CP2 transcription factor-domain-containing protein [Gilbertella persicaria]